MSNVSSSSSSAKQFLTRRVRSHSKTDNQSVTEKSLFSRFFPKKPKKSIALITTNAKSLDLPLSNARRVPLVNQSSLSSNEPQSTIDEEENENEREDDENDEQNVSGASLSDDEQHQPKTNPLPVTRSSNNSRTSSGSTKTSTQTVTPTILPASDSQYYASMSAAPKGFSISYHKCMSKGNDNLRKQAAFGRLQQHQQNNPNNAGATQLMVGSMSKETEVDGTRVVASTDEDSAILFFFFFSLPVRRSCPSSLNATTHCLRCCVCVCLAFTQDRFEIAKKTAKIVRK